jgi:hypothetical protein
MPIPANKRSQMEEYLEFINMLPLDKKGKMEFVKAHIDRLKQYEEETKNNKNMFERCLEEIKIMGQDLEVFCECYDEEKSCDGLCPLPLRRS